MVLVGVKDTCSHNMKSIRGGSVCMDALVPMVV